MKVKDYKLNQRLTRDLSITLNRAEGKGNAFAAVLVTDMIYEPRDFLGTQYFSEKLLCNPENVDLSRINSGTGISFLFNHDVNRQIGKSYNAVAGGAEVTATVEFDSDAVGQSFRDKFLRSMGNKISIAYTIQRADVKNMGTHLDVTATRWRINEVSLVSVPADFNAEIKQGETVDVDDDDVNPEPRNLGEQRSHCGAQTSSKINQSGDKNMAIKKENVGSVQPESAEQSPEKVLVQEVVSQRADAQADVVGSIVRAAKELGVPEVAANYMGSTESYNMRDFFVLAGKAHQKKGEQTEAARLLSTKDVLPAKDLARVNPSEVYVDFVSKTSLRGAAAEEQQELVRREGLSRSDNVLHLAPSLVRSLIANQRAGVANVVQAASAMPNMVPNVIDIVHAKTWTGRTGVNITTVPSMETITLPIPTVDGGVLLQDGAAQTLGTNAALGNKSWAPKNYVSASYAIGHSAQYLAINLEGIIANDLVTDLGVTIDKVCLQGNTARSFEGIMGNSSIGKVGSAATPTGAAWSQVTSAINLIEETNRMTDSINWVFGTGAANKYRSTLMAGSGTDNFLMLNDDLFGYQGRSVVTTLGAKGGTGATAYSVAVALVPEDFRLFLFGPARLIRDEATNVSSGGIVLRLFQNLDAKLTRDGSAVAVYVKTA